MNLVKCDLLRSGSPNCWSRNFFKIILLKSFIGNIFAVLGVDFIAVGQGRKSLQNVFL